MKKLLFGLLIAGMVIFAAAPAMAADSTEEDRQLGQLTEEQLAEFIEQQPEFCQECIQEGISTRHFNLMPHRHEIKNITRTYTTEELVGNVYSFDNPYNNPAVATYEKSRTVSNKWDASIDFAAAAVTAGVGWEAELSSTETASYEVNVPAYKSVTFRLYEKYNAKDFSCTTTYFPTGQDPRVENGTGTAKQFSMFRFTYTITSL